MVEGASGLLSVARDERPLWSPSRRRLEWPNGAVGYTFSSEEPDALRGPQFINKFSVNRVSGLKGGVVVSCRSDTA